MGPVLLSSTGLNVPFSSLMGSFVAGAIGGALAIAFVRVVQRRRDRELEVAANSALREAGLPSNVRAAVKNSRVLLTGEVAEYSQRHLAQQALSALPDVAGVNNHLHLRFTGRGWNTEEIKRRIADSFQHHAGLDAHQIQVHVQQASIVLEGTVHSSDEATEVEEIAWDIEGIQQVENRLKIAA